jgi:hypothetical protein
MGIDGSSTNCLASVDVVLSQRMWEILVLNWIRNKKPERVFYYEDFNFLQSQGIFI